MTLQHAHKPALALLGALVLLTASSGCRHEEHHAHETPKLLVTTPLQRDTELTREYVAQIHAARHIELRAIERGYLQEISVDEGKQVKKGDKLFQIMPMIYQAELQRARIVTNDAAVVVDNGHPGRNRVERHRPFTARLGDLLVQARVDDRYGDVIGETQQYARVSLVEVDGAVEHGECADDAARCRQRHDDRVPDANEPLCLTTDVGILRH